MKVIEKVLDPVKDARRTEDVEAILTQSIQHLEEHGWLKGFPQDETGRGCSLNAMCKVSKATPLEPCYMAAVRELATCIPPRFYNAHPEFMVINWNDSDSTSWEDVRGTFRRAISKQRKRGPIHRALSWLMIRLGELMDDKYWGGGSR